MAEIGVFMRVPQPSAAAQTLFLDILTFKYIELFAAMILHFLANFPASRE
jgi:hypothetical protein